MPCYTEGRESLEKTINSLASTDYPDSRKLLFCVCDGMVMGSGNDQPTPAILLNLLGIDDREPVPVLPYVALGNEHTSYNFGQVYSGVYLHNDRKIPVVVVVKVGQPGERNKPGNRGKRDSQLILMRFLNKVFYHSPMTPLELELYYSMAEKLKVSPEKLEYALMVDADTIVQPPSLAELALYMTYDVYCMGVTGVTEVANPWGSPVSMTQVYEYFQSHHLAKAFESLFGIVTCLPGCFSMWRIKDADRDLPLLVANDIVHEYGVQNVTTLHEKNLLYLGEDRYLTTLMIKNFPGMKTKFTPEAVCKTDVPTSWRVFLSQRRRWINSTVHNLFELLIVKNLCGFCCLSMRFLVFLDIFSTFVLPGATMFIGYLIYMLVTSPLPPWTSFLMLAAMYGIQILVILARGEVRYVGWLFIHLLALPIYGIVLPLYSFWHFDDFSWGQTRLTASDLQKKKHDADELGNSGAVLLNVNLMPMAKWSASNTSWRTADYGFNVTGSSKVPPEKVTVDTLSALRKRSINEGKQKPITPTTPKLD